jgi:hypothetical protein
VITHKLDRLDRFEMGYQLWIFYCNMTNVDVSNTRRKHMDTEDRAEPLGNAARFAYQTIVN